MTYELTDTEETIPWHNEYDKSVLSRGDVNYPQHLNNVTSLA